MDATKIKISTVYANGLGNKIKRLDVAKWLKENSSGIVVLQETHSVPETESKWKQDFDIPNIYT